MSDTKLLERCTKALRALLGFGKIEAELSRQQEKLEELKAQLDEHEKRIVTLINKTGRASGQLEVLVRLVEQDRKR